MIRIIRKYLLDFRTLRGFRTSRDGLGRAEPALARRDNQRERRRLRVGRSGGFSLLEIMIVLALIGMIGAGIAVVVNNSFQKAKQKIAKERIKELGIRNVRFRYGDGIAGWKAHSPFDGILVAAAPLTVPEALIQQLKVGGRLLVPVGPEGEQQLIRFTRKEQRIDKESLGPVAFVPLLGGMA